MAIWPSGQRGGIHGIPDQSALRVFHWRPWRESPLAASLLLSNRKLVAAPSVMAGEDGN